ncbi:GNAT family N-acetyltransferase [Aggregatimonas sangjinii]|uniref:GNAT family N-acetyltransferase n=1 Tax=Aggregatimonas sangjinii TaxID=2583587 RepID=A0A5B7SS10_9FLAO|nr:GNAT family N-acetyltransferase [Aggregatimonas sangjinii]QCW99822.1 GNAT family N-acetyltransferase [Aggregatimonas sangjinii]
MIRATQADRKLVVNILVEAFEPLDDNNSINFVVKQDDKRTQRMQVLMGYLFDTAMRTGEVFLSDNRASCLLITYAHKDKFSIAKLWSTLQLAFRCIGIERVGKVLKRQKIIQRNYPEGKYIRPMIFAVKNEFKGTVTAAKLIMQVFNDFKKNELPIIVDTASEEHVRLYQKFGLKVFKKEEGLGFPIYLLRMNRVMSPLATVENV